jgi:NAD(P)-dependent dehydrogenase (short-subunit alcohol dehydrogenase family)
VSKLAGKIALITGGNSGIGLATAKAFVGEGAYVFITGRRASESDIAVKEIGSNVTAVRGDVSKLGDLDRLFAQIRREKGKLDIVFANAGVAKYSVLGEITEDLYEEHFSGGHFITGAWALVMIYDYHHGRDFVDEGLELQQSMFAEFTPQLADRYIERFQEGFNDIDFSPYSKVKNPKLKRYNFGFVQLLD